MVEPSSFDITKQSSTTYFLSSLFFPSEVRDDVFKLYAFVRTADNFVDRLPQDTKGFYNFIDEYYSAKESGNSESRIIRDFLELETRYRFSPIWIQAFFKAMEADLYKAQYKTIEETCHYMYGSAEVIGLMLAQIFGLPQQSWSSARLLGRAMQYINMIRDIAEDVELGRQYLPTKELERAGFTQITQQAAEKNQQAFSGLIKAQIDRYLGWQQEAQKGFALLPRSIKLPVATASAMYHWTAMSIYNDPMLVWQGKLKPSKMRVLATATRLAMTLN